jgi:hypothetical protein
MFRVILGCYADIKSCVKNGDLQSNTGSFPCEAGLREGVKLSLVLFVLYLNDLEEYLSVNYVNHLEFLNGYCMQHIGVYLKLFLLLHADDTFMFAESAEELQLALNIFEKYSSEWKLSIHVSKTKIVVLFKKKV